MPPILQNGFGGHERRVDVHSLLGLGGALALTGYLRSLLFGVTPTDAATFAATPLLFVAIALAACWIPARRALRLDPVRVLRGD